MKAELPNPITEELTGSVAVELLKSPASEKAVSESSGNDFGTISEANLPRLLRLSVSTRSSQPNRLLRI